MTLTAGTRAPGRPGVFLAPAPTTAPLLPERLDVAGFVGVALRGPVDQPVAVERWSDYELLFGGFERPEGGPERLLPHAVSAFFRQGGKRAYVLRVAPHGDEAGDPLSATAQFRLSLPGVAGGLLLAAANEGPWGSGLVPLLRYDVAQRVSARVDGDLLLLPAGTRVSVGTLLRLRSPHPVEAGADRLRWVTAVENRVSRGAPVPVALDRSVPTESGGTVSLDVVTGTLDVRDLSAPDRLGERITDLHLRYGHPRYLANVLEASEHLLRPLGDWTADLAPTSELAPVLAEKIADGGDRSGLVDYYSFFDPGDDAAQDPLGEEPHVGVDLMGRVAEIGLLCVPDLTWPTTGLPPPAPPVVTWVPRTRCCNACDQGPAEPEYASVEAPPPGLDARNPEELKLIEDRQQRLVEVARLRRRFVALLDVPNGLSAAQISQWRARFDSSYTAAYHPWLAVARTPGEDAVAVPPSAFAAGIIAERELRLGLPWGPANELARDAIRSESVVTDELHDLLHGLGINVFRAERDGFRLSAGRTLSQDPEYRQLSVRRLMTMLRLSLERQTQWLAFEPNNDELRERLKRVVTSFLRELNLKGAFAGATEEQSFFVRCEGDVNPASSVALGRLIAEIGVAPSSPIEYVLVRIARDVDGSLSVVTDEG